VIAGFIFSGCLENAGIAVKRVSALSTNQTNCLLPNARAVKSAARRLAAKSEMISSDVCTNPGGYDCFAHQFGPSLVNGEAVVGESVDVPALGGDVSLSVVVQSFNTLGLARMTSASASQPGGELNHVEYICHQHDLFEADGSLGVGEGAHLRDALSAAYAQCAAVAPRLARDLR
jgi:hypothetical protein